MTFAEAVPGSWVKLWPDKIDTYLVAIEVDDEGNEVRRRLIHLAYGVTLRWTPLDTPVYPAHPEIM